MRQPVYQAEQQYLNMHTYIRVYIRIPPISVRSVGSTLPFDKWLKCH